MYETLKQFILTRKPADEAALQRDGQHYHVSITLSAYGYSTYRGN